MSDVAKYLALALLAVGFPFWFAAVWNMFAPEHLQPEWFRRYCCRKRMHSRDYDPMFHDGASAHAKCRWCGFEGLVDSQGGLF